MVDIVLVSHPDQSSARTLVDRLVREHWIACGHVFPPGMSVFFWEGQTRTDTENILLLKSLRSNRAELEREIRKEHPYTVPEILFISVDHGNEDYLAWVRESCTQPYQGD